ncbi:APC family permease [Arthrobacter sp. PAMC25284]|uniref:APC family permease n=1 Tax=Arthrobacter sp. PAMC25284 TaxID=2861279 RepID=UPI001C624F7A|nr:APC family permease [Arthrobacter sp. PAMC25284]QYF90378.1 APC family permease [Arthrobacter sp. PAMC25284]
MALTSSNATTAVTPPALDRRRLGVLSVTFMIVAASAPLTVLAGGVTTTFAVTGVMGVPLSFILLGLVLTLFAVGYAAMSRFVTNAGAFYAYIAQGLSRPLGVGAALVALVAYNLMQVGLYGLFGFTVASMLSAKFGIAVPWWVPVIVCIAVVAALGVNRVDLSAKVLGVLVGLEFLAVMVYDIMAFAAAPEGASAVALSPESLFVPGIGAVFSFGIAAFMGFESAAIYGEESKDPRKTVARATYLAVAVISTFYAISAWAMTVGAGPSAIIAESTRSGPDLMFVFLETHGAVLLSDLAQILFVTSIFAALVSFHNAVARYFFSLGREQVVPVVLSRVRRTSGAPFAGSLAQTAIAVVLTTGFAMAGSGSELGELYPVLTMFTWLTNSGALGLVLLMSVVSLAVIGFFLRRGDRDISVWKHRIAPALAFMLLGTVTVLIVVNFDVLLGQPEPTALTYLLPAIIFLPGVAGVLWGLRLKRTRPALYQAIGHGPEQSPED